MNNNNMIKVLSNVSNTVFFTDKNDFENPEIKNIHLHVMDDNGDISRKLMGTYPKYDYVKLEDTVVEVVSKVTGFKFYTFEKDFNNPNVKMIGLLSHLDDVKDYHSTFNDKSFAKSNYTLVKQEPELVEVKSKISGMIFLTDIVKFNDPEVSMIALVDPEEDHDDIIKDTPCFVKSNYILVEQEPELVEVVSKTSYIIYNTDKNDFENPKVTEITLYSQKCGDKLLGTFPKKNYNIPEYIEVRSVYTGTIYLTEKSAYENLSIIYITLHYHGESQDWFKKSDYIKVEPIVTEITISFVANPFDAFMDAMEDLTNEIEEHFNDTKEFPLTTLSQSDMDKVRENPKSINNVFDTHHNFYLRSHGELKDKGFCLSSKFEWTIEKDKSGVDVLVPRFRK